MKRIPGLFIIAYELINPRKYSRRAEFYADKKKRFIKSDKNPVPDLSVWQVINGEGQKCEIEAEMIKCPEKSFKTVL